MEGISVSIGDGRCGNDSAVVVRRHDCSPETCARTDLSLVTVIADTVPRANLGKNEFVRLLGYI